MKYRFLYIALYIAIVNWIAATKKWKWLVYLTKPAVILAIMAYVWRLRPYLIASDGRFNWLIGALLFSLAPPLPACRLCRRWRFWALVPTLRAAVLPAILGGDPQSALQWIAQLRHARFDELEPAAAAAAAVLTFTYADRIPLYFAAEGVLLTDAGFNCRVITARLRVGCAAS